MNRMSFMRARNGQMRSVGFFSIVWLLLLAFTAQSFITQIHIHSTGAGSTLQLVKAPASLQPHEKVPVPDGKASCPFCQAIVHAGAFFVPTQNFPLQVVNVEIVPPFLVAYAVEGFSPHPWYSRGPPRR
jgi:hypothetical protein